jgi:capsule biosynthesis phosphatase
MIYVFDLDDTLCTTRGLPASLSRHDKYRNAVPLKSNIEKLKKLYFSDNSVIIHTARGMLTNNNDVTKVIEDIGDITKVWLDENQVPYHQLVFGKPYGDVYVDDKALNVEDF